MTLTALLSHLSLADGIAVTLLFADWALLVHYIEHPPKSRPSVTYLMAHFRREWMRIFVTRQPRIFDGGVVESLRQSTAFFASASMIALGACIALLGDSGRLMGFATQFIPDACR